MPSTDNGNNFLVLDLHPGADFDSSGATDVNNVTTTPLADGVLITFKVTGQASDTVGTYAVIWEVSVTRTSAGQSVSWTMVNLNGRIDPASGWRLIEGRAVNDSGQVLCDSIFGGKSRPVLLTPNP